MKDLAFAPLGKVSPYISTYKPELLFAIPRQSKRNEIGINAELPFQGVDIWNSYEVSWLNTKGKPIVAAAEFRIPCESPHLIESKSFKLYLNSFNNTQFESFAAVQQTLIQDLSRATGSIVNVELFPLHKASSNIVHTMQGILLDDLDIECDTYTPHPSYLLTEDAEVSEVLCTDLLKSNCLVTGQPDWASLQIIYLGKKIHQEGLLKYIVSLRNHEEFHEQCVERIFMDIMQYCQPKQLCVYARYTRRGGLDINPCRTNFAVTVDNLRTWRQ